MSSNAPLRGHKATLEFNRTGFTITPQRLYAGEVKPVEYTKEGAEDIALHHKNLQAAIRTNEALKCDHMLGYYGVVAARMGHAEPQRIERDHPAQAAVGLAQQVRVGEVQETQRLGAPAPDGGPRSGVGVHGGMIPRVKGFRALTNPGRRFLGGASGALSRRESGIRQRDRTTWPPEREAVRCRWEIPHGF